MLVRGKASRIQLQTGSYQRPICLSRGYKKEPLFTTPSASSPPIQHAHVYNSALRRSQAAQTRSFSTSWTRRATGSAIAASESPLDHSSRLPAGVTFEKQEDVRSYLRKWSDAHQKTIKENAPDQVLRQRDAVLPNSLFIGKVNEAAANAEEVRDLESETAESETGTEFSGMGNEEDGTFTALTRVEVGDAFRITVKNVRSQLAICVGQRGVQSLYFLADGRWLADCRSTFNSHIVHGFATEDDISRIEKHLPRRTIEYLKAEDGAKMPFTTSGDIPHADARPLLDKLAKLAEEMEVAKRDHSTINQRLYDELADEHEFKQWTFDDIVTDVLGLDLDELTDGARIFLYNEVAQDERLTTWHGRQNILNLCFLPKKLHRSATQVTQWARAYQDAAARAAIGRSVSEELKENPLIPFISKARRLISKSRKIRLPTTECQLGPTLENVRPPAGTVERVSTGETFTEQEKMIIEFLWLVYAKRPLDASFGTLRNAAIASMIVRAVGAYPKYRLDLGTGMLFLKELGCIDPWATSSDHFISVASPITLLNQGGRLRKEKTVHAAKAAGFLPGNQVPHVSDSMAHLRKDWGDLPVFCVDGRTTRVVDDGVSIEQSRENPEDHWLHVHVAHISAFLDPRHPIFTLGPYMGAAQYDLLGSEPYLPYEVLDMFSLQAGRPVLTFSTLIGADGSLKETRIHPGIVRNVISIDIDQFANFYPVPSTRNSLTVGPLYGFPEPADDEIRNQEQRDLIERHRDTLDCLQRVVLSRWRARYRDNPAHIKLPKLPNVSTKIFIHPSNVVRDGRSYERIFRSEHLIGDLSIRAACSLGDLDNVPYCEQQIGSNVVAGAMIQACETAAIWTAERGIPIVYRSSKSASGFDLSKLNSLGPHDFYVNPLGFESLEINPGTTLATAGYTYVTNPLRRYRDVQNHAQIDAYLKAQANQTRERSEVVQYPYSRQDLLQNLRRDSDGFDLVKQSKLETNQWLFMMFYRAFYFQEAKLPEIWDVYVSNPVRIGYSSAINNFTTTEGKIWAFGLSVEIQPSEQGWEKWAKFRQWIPAKVISVDPATARVLVEAVGPPTDRPALRDIQFPPLGPE